MKIRAWVVLILLLVAGLVVLDRVGADVAEGRIADHFPCHTSSKADVSINGFPFLTQAIGGVYDDIEVACPQYAFSTVTDARLTVYLNRAHVALSDALNGVDQVPVDVLSGQLFIPYASLARSSGVTGLTLKLQDGHIAAQAPIDAPVVGTVQISALGDFIDPGDGVTLSLHDFKSNGADVPSLLSGLLSAFTKIRLLQNAPYGIRIVSATPTSTGVLFTGRADGVVLRRAGS